MKSNVLTIQELVSFAIMPGFWFVVWFATDWLHHYY